MTPNWWERVNRETEIAIVRDFARNGGCVAFLGDQYAGRREFAALAAKQLQDSGLIPISYRPPHRLPSDTKTCLIQAWKLLPINYSTAGIRPWVRYSDRTPYVIAARLSEALASEERKFGFVFLDIGANNMTIAPQELEAFEILAAQRICVVLVLPEDVSTNALTHPATVLKAFSRQEIVTAIEKTDELSYVPAAATVAKLFEDWDESLVRPSITYGVLSAWHRQGYPRVWESV